MKFLFTIVFLISLYQFANGQFTDSTTMHARLNSGGSINKTNDGSSYLLNNNAQFNIRKKRTSFNSSAGWLYGESPDKLTNNDFVLSSTINLYRHFADFYYWGLINYTSSYSLNIKGQGQIGIGVAYNFFNTPNIWLNVSNGIVGERSKIIEGDSAIVTYQTIRNSLRIQFQYKMGDHFLFRTSNFFQPSFQYIRDHIISSDSELSYKLWKGLNLNMKLTY
ncbi:MAG: DUF481 domain-containing protein, partial [Niabella sp.]